MKVASFIFGILGGLISLLYGLFGYGLGSFIEMGDLKFISLALPIAALAGAGIVLAKPIICAILMALATIGLLLILGFNFFSLIPVVLLGLGSFLGFLDSKDTFKKAFISGSVSKSISNNELKESSLLTESISITPELVENKNLSEELSNSKTHPKQDENIKFSLKSKFTIPLLAILAIESFALIFIASNLKSSKDDLKSALAEKEALINQLKQETQSRLTAESQLQTEQQKRLLLEQQARSEQQARKAAEQRIQTEQEAKRVAEDKAREAQRIAFQGAEARKQAESVEARSLAREQALTSQKNAAEIQAKRNYELSLSRIENDYKQSQTRITEFYQRQVSLAAGRPDRISRAKEKYQEDLSRAEKIYIENKARAKTLYKDELTRAQKTYQQLSLNK
jgi:hypothetical protein